MLLYIFSRLNFPIVIYFTISFEQPLATSNLYPLNRIVYLIFFFFSTIFLLVSS
ncbi:hypothetical protein BGX38DRAFT_1211943 [Terfezia claveryi]|nr:hypothetical protein BGX38DRAFT_1240769 [Terfezia claveryi]KAF8437346.1 hypothetical protein BGX38DRAFT_1211943 [Terfezia claveryi]